VAALSKSQASYQNSLAAQNASMQTAQNTVAQNQAALQTQQMTAAQTLAPPTRAALDGTSAQVANAKAAVQQAQNNFDAATLVASTSGTVASLNGVVGQWIGGGPTSSGSSSSTSSTTSTSSTGSAFITLMDVSAPQVQAQISEADIGKVQPGQKATFTVTAYPNRTFSGTVASIQPSGTTTSNVVTYNVLVSVDKSDVTLLPSMTATVSIITDQADNATLVPNSALSYAGGQSNAVVVLRDGNPVRVPVQTGITDGSNTVIVSGIQPGDQVVTAASSASSTARTGTTSGSGNIFGFGGPPGGANRGGAAQGGQQQGTGAGAGAQTGQAGGAPGGGVPAGGPPAGGPTP
jgi:multidrug efflux pump subunit AcrA (membrane-fusion protein)